PSAVRGGEPAHARGVRAEAACGGGGAGFPDPGQGRVRDTDCGPLPDAASRLQPGVPMTIQPVRPERSLLDGRFYADDPHAHFLWMRQHEPVYWDEQEKVWGSTRHEHLP